ncbi:MAG: hypothetical protein NT087_06025 [Deltaproteobacteria bacterium]|nr:hypothetical protein [Deltaproteobacteria bacterium]MCX5875838.1 hypothetical protein [Deltaproteobacteria bacterium]
MPVDSINTTNPVLPTALQSQVQTSVPLATSPLNLVKNPVAVAVAATQNLTPAQQAALLGSNAVQALNLQPTAPAEPLLADNTTPPTTILESQGLSPAQEAALAVNETVQTALETQNLTPAQQAALATNQATQTLVTPLAVPEPTIPAAAGVAGQTPAPVPVETTLAVTPAGTATTGVTSATTAATPAVTATPITDTTVASEVPAPNQPTTAQPIPYQNAFAAYEIRNPTPPPPDPSPIRKGVHPPLPIGRVRHVDPLVLRQEWEKRKKNRSKETGSQEGTPPRPPLAEKSIHQMIKQANEDLAASGVPLHLVLAKNDEGFALDIYNCSDDAVCQMTQEVPLDLNNLLTTLDNLEHEAGIIVNIKT